MKIAPRFVRWIVIPITTLLVLAAAAVYVLSRTRPGIERAGAYVVDQIGNSLRGQLRVGDITSTSLLGGAVLHDVSITMSNGRPFLVADSIRLRYSLLRLLRGQIAFDRVDLFRPAVTLEQLPGDSMWNYDRLLETGTPSPRPGGTSKRTLVLEEAHIHDGRLVIREPWRPGPGADTVNLILDTVPGGRVRVIRFDDVNAVLPQALIESPTTQGRRFRFDGLSARVGIWRQPIPVRDLRGTVEITDSIIGLAIRDVALPASHAAVRGRIIVGSRGERYDLQFVDAEAAFEDFHWLFPQLPAEGSAQLDLTMSTQPNGQLSILAQNMRLRSGRSRLSGTFGLLLGDPLRFTNVQVHAEPVDLALVDRFVGRALPVQGMLTGDVALDGPLTDLRTHGTASLDGGADSQPEAAVTWDGAVSLAAPLAARNLEVQVERLGLGLVAHVAPQLTLPGAVTGRLHLDGRLDQGLTFDGRLEQTGRTSILARGTLTRTDAGASLDAHVDLQPVDLPSLAAQFPQLRGVQGQARGAITVQGPLRDLKLNADLETQAGKLALNGQLDRTGAEPRYQASGNLTDLRPQELFPTAPDGRISGHFELEGVGTKAEIARGTVSVALAGARIRELNIDGASVRLTVDSGLVHVDTLYARAAFGRLDARGNFGIARGMRGHAEVELMADSLEALRSFVESDSVLDPTAPPPLEGRLRLNATLDGTLEQFDARGEMHVAGFRLRNVSMDSADAHFVARDVRTPDQAFDVQLEGRNLRGYGRAFASVTASASYQDSTGSATVHSLAPGGTSLQVAGDYTLENSGVRMRLDTLAFQVGAQPWRLAAPADVRIATDGLQVDSVRLSRDGTASLRLAGSLPWRPEQMADTVRLPADFVMEAHALPIGEFLRLAQSDTSLDGSVEGRVIVRGTAREPQVDGQLSVRQLRYERSALDSLRTQFSYAARSLQTQLRAWKDGDQILVGEGTVPVNLAFAGVGDRRLDQPLQLRMQATQLPAGLVLAFVGGFRDVQGQIDGQIRLTGTTRQPELGGALTIQNGAATWDALGVRYRRLQGEFQMTGRDVVSVKSRFDTRNGFATVDGTVTFKPAADPELALDMHAQNFQAARRRDFQGIASGNLHLAGHYRRPLVTGSLRLTQGTLNLDELWRQTQIVQLQSPFLFEVVDTTFTPVRQVVPTTTSPFLENIRVNADLQIGSDMWLRGQQLNMAVNGDLTVNIDRQTQSIAMTGTLQSVRGTYQFEPGANRYQAFTQPFVQKQFDIQQGTIEFVGTPGIDPNLNVTATHEVQTQTSGQLGRLTIQANVTGTLQNPRVQLTSDAQPPISETDLISYLYFGRPSFVLSGSQSQLFNLMTGAASTALQSVFSSWGVFDYVGVSTQYNTSTAQSRLEGTVLEAGRYVAPDVFLAGSVRYPLGTVNSQTVQLPLADLFGLRLEWQFTHTWALEAYWESRFLRQPPSGLDVTLLAEQQQILGLSLFRQWSY
jgi:autotransporter translocation and assembly factor TamB